MEKRAGPDRKLIHLQSAAVSYWREKAFLDSKIGKKDMLFTKPEQKDIKHNILFFKRVKTQQNIYTATN
jgi:hypothetical protein